MSDEKKKAIILIDYENLFGGAAQKYQLKLTDEGLEHLISYFQEKYILPDEHVLVVCRYEDYPGLLNTVSGLSYIPINALEKAKDIADTYLIAYGVKDMVMKKEEIDEVILVGGDGIYSSLVRVAASIFSKVNIVSWENSLSSLLLEAQKKKTNLILLEEIFNIKDGTEAALTAGWFETYGLSPVEKEIISFLLPITQGFQLVPLANIIKDWDNPHTIEEFSGEYKKVFTYLRGCARGDGFLKEERKPDPKGGRDVIWIKLKTEHLKVKHVIK
ncbi:hypothetical protein PDN34_28390 [Bacillus cereus]|nr:hypothetical protein [Bacillus cereus]